MSHVTFRVLFLKEGTCLRHSLSLYCNSLCFSMSFIWHCCVWGLMCWPLSCLMAPECLLPRMGDNWWDKELWTWCYRSSRSVGPVDSPCRRGPWGRRRPQQLYPGWLHWPPEPERSAEPSWQVCRVESRGRRPPWQKSPGRPLSSAWSCPQLFSSWAGWRCAQYSRPGWWRGWWSG